MIVGQGTVDIVKVLSFKGMKGCELSATTAPALVSPRTAENGRYPWDSAGIYNTKISGIVKVGRVRGILGAEWEKLVTAERLRKCEGLDANGNPILYTCNAPRNRTKWVVNGDGDRMAFKTNEEETALYCPLVVVTSLGYDYFTLDGVKIAKDIVTPFLRDRSKEGVRQGLTEPLVYRDYRADHINTLTIGNTATEGDAKRLAEALLNGGDHPTEKGVTARSIAEALMPNVQTVTG